MGIVGRGVKMEKLLTTREIANLLSVRPGTIQKWIQAGKIPFYRLGHRSLRFDLEEIGKWLEKKKSNNRRY
jgi:excisionase family DNA binding protein